MTDEERRERSRRAFDEFGISIEMALQKYAEAHVNNEGMIPGAVITIALRIIVSNLIIPSLMNLNVPKKLIKKELQKTLDECFAHSLYRKSDKASIKA